MKRNERVCARKECAKVYKYKAYHWFPEYCSDECVKADQKDSKKLSGTDPPKPKRR